MSWTHYVSSEYVPALSSGQDGFLILTQAPFLIIFHSDFPERGRQSRGARWGSILSSGPASRSWRWESCVTQMAMVRAAVDFGNDLMFTWAARKCDVIPGSGRPPSWGSFAGDVSSQS